MLLPCAITHAPRDSEKLASDVREVSVLSSQNEGTEDM